MASSRPGWVKICGITVEEDVDHAHEAGADAIGLNFWPASPRFVDEATALRLAEHARGRLEIVLVCVNADESELRRWMQVFHPTAVQLHGDEPDELVCRLSPHAYKAVGVGSPGDVARALSVPGDRVLIDAWERSRRGGTGLGVPSDLAAEVCSKRRAVLAGGLGPENVCDRIRAVRPWGVDVSSGVERWPGRKDSQRVKAFVREAHRAWRAMAEVDHV